ncbi:MAG: hypothetical protein NTZ05_18830, partial [Chloroflexi bacterium]|nr:hypothetical protein [Chloroflexota bacterium]
MPAAIDGVGSGSYHVDARSRINVRQSERRTPWGSVQGRRSMSYENLIYEQRGYVALVTLNRPERMNAL